MNEWTIEINSIVSILDPAIGLSARLVVLRGHVWSKYYRELIIPELENDDSCGVRSRLVGWRDRGGVDGTKQQMAHDRRTGHGRRGVPGQGDLNVVGHQLLGRGAAWL